MSFLFSINTRLVWHLRLDLHNSPMNRTAPSVSWVERMLISLMSAPWILSSTHKTSWGAAVKADVETCGCKDCSRKEGRLKTNILKFHFLLLLCPEFKSPNYQHKTETDGKAESLYCDLAQASPSAGNSSGNGNSSSSAGKTLSEQRSSFIVGKALGLPSPQACDWLTPIGEEVAYSWLAPSIRGRSSWC